VFLAESFCMLDLISFLEFERMDDAFEELKIFYTN